jgi:hypothetical protein
MPAGGIDQIIHTSYTQGINSCFRASPVDKRYSAEIKVTHESSGKDHDRRRSLDYQRLMSFEGHGGASRTWTILQKHNQWSPPHRLESAKRSVPARGRQWHVSRIERHF